MSQINSISLSALANAAHLLFMQNTLAETKKDDNVKVVAPSTLTALESAIALEDKYYHMPRKSEHTAVIDDNLDIFMKLLTKVRVVARVASVSASTEEEKSAGSRVYILEQSYKIAAETHMQRKIGMAQNLVGDLQGDSYKANVETLGLTDTVTQMATLVSATNTLVLTRSNDWAQVPKGALKAARLKVDALYTNLVTAVNATITLAAEADKAKYDDFVGLMNVEIRRLRINELGTSADSKAVTSDDDSESDSSSDSESTTVTKYTLTLAASPAAGGTVTGAGEYESGTSVAITAAANSGYSFSQWSDGNTNASRSVTLSADTSLTATFTADSSEDAGSDEGFHA